MKSPNPGYRSRQRFGGMLFLALMLALLQASLSAQNLTQTFTLRPGWNALHLNVEPTNAEPAAVFNGSGVDAVWTFSTRLSAVEFIQDPNEPLWNRSSWRVYLPTGSPGAFQTSLFKILGNRPYLVHSTNTANVTLNVTGVPAFRPLDWVPDSFNLRGFPIDPANQPSFQQFFRPATAHFNGATDRLERVYRLNASGAWTLVNQAELMEAGVAYWVYSRGASTFQAPLELQINFGDGLHYGATLVEQGFALLNLGTATKAVQIIGRSPLNTAPLAYRNPDPVDLERWLPIPAPQVIAVDAGERSPQRWAIKRQEFTANDYANLLEISDGEGTLWYLPVTARRPILELGSPATATQREAKSRAGLWVGNVILDGVAEVNAGPLYTNELKQVTRVSTATSVTATHDFNVGLLPGAELFGAAFLSNGVVELNPVMGGQGGALRLPDLAPGRTAGGFTASFRARVKSIENASPGDGFSFNWASDLPAAAYGETGTGSGLRVAFDTYPNSPDDLGIKVYWGPTLIARAAELSLASTNDTFVNISIRLYPGGKLDLSYAGRQIFGNLPIPGYQPQTGGKFGFGGRTGAAIESHGIDDVQLQLFLEPLTATTTPARTELSMRLLLHVDADGQTRLLRDVIQMWQNGTYNTDAQGRKTVATPGRFVLLTDDSLIGRYSGAALRDGQPVGRRLSTASYDWDGTNTFLPMTNLFAVGNTVTATLNLSPNAPTNPFRHKFHPDHDNLDTTFTSYQQEAYPITRKVDLTLTSSDPEGRSSADYGYSVIGGTYRETITGLHREALVTSGRFRLTRVAETSDLNP